MTIVRNTLAVIAGYAIFVISTLMLFRFSNVDPHADATLGFLVFAIAYGALFSFVGGFAAQRISGSGTLMINYILAAILAGFALFSLLKTDGNHYSQISAIIVFAPVSIVGGVVCLRRK